MWRVSSRSGVVILRTAIRLLPTEHQVDVQWVVLAQDVLDEWVTCQRQWLYLEPIFSSEDINRQLPVESKRYQTMDRLWRKIMKNAKDTPQVSSELTMGWVDHGSGWVWLGRDQEISDDGPTVAQDYEERQGHTAG